MTKPKLRPPRDYTKRREQLRLFMMVGGLFLIIIVIQQARQPDRWRWLTGEAPPAGDDIDTHVRAIDQGGSGDLPGTIIAKSFQFRPDAVLDDQERAARRTEKDIWRQQLESLHWTERREVSRVLKAVRDKKPLSSEQAEKWGEILGLLDERWIRHIADAKDAVLTETKLDDQDRADWLNILVNLEQTWTGGLKDALATAPEPAQLDDAQRAALASFETLYDEMAMEEIRDDTVISRPNEVNAWFRMFENLQNSSADELAQLDESAAPRVGFRQLHQQPQDYRGKLVHIHGAARRAEMLDAPPNVVGIERYYAFTVLPAGGPNSPIIVYTLGVPPGFPQVHPPTEDGQINELREEVEFTGYFVKRMAYEAQDGTRIAPLIIAKSPTWIPREVREAATLPDWRIALAVVLGLALASAGLAAYVYVKHLKSSDYTYGPAHRATPQQFAALAEEPVLPSPAESLAALAQHGHAPAKQIHSLE